MDAAASRSLTLPQVVALANDLIDAMRLDEARPLVAALIAQLPGEDNCVHTAGRLAFREQRMADAIACYDQLALRHPDDAQLRWHRALALLAHGDFERGWREFEHRVRLTKFNVDRGFAAPQWHGEDLSGRTILLHAEGGHGDALHFCRYVPLVAARGGPGATVLVESQPALTGLLRSLGGASAIFARGQPLPPFDFHCPFQSLPIVFGTTLATVPAAVPYLQAPPDTVARWRQKLGGAAAPRMRVGLCWSGSTGGARSDTLATFASLAGIPGVEFHSLQHGQAAHEPRPPGLAVLDHDAELTDFSETAALASNLDLVISVDTSIAHLAGALGRPTWTLIPRTPDFRWMLHRADSPWYPTMRLFRQPLDTADWQGVACEIAVALRSLAAAPESITLI